MSSASSDSPGSSLDTPLWYVVPAAGSGQRLGGKLAKQYHSLNGTPMLKRTVERLMAVPDVAGIVVVLADGDEHWPSLGLDEHHLLHSVIGGASRASSVIAGLQYVLQQSPADTWVMVHDAARPLVALSDIQRLVNAVYNSGAIGGLLATPVHDTLKRADDYASIVETVERDGLWQAQTPQLFRNGALLDAMLEAMQNKPDAITDEASAMELAGHEPLLVEALQPNFKITRPVDWTLASALLSQQHKANS